MKKTTSNSIKRNLTMTLSLMMTATMLASCGSGYDGSESRKSGSYNNERTTAENYRSSNVTDRKSTRLNSSHRLESRMPSSA